MRSNTSNVLPINFTPTSAHIIIGRGRVVKLHSGNRKLDQMVAAIAQDYSSASGKAEKGMILSRLIDQIHDAAPDAGFVKRDPVTGRWYTVEESLARTTAAQALRNYLNGEYRSSKQYKQKRRLEQIEHEMIGNSASSGTMEGSTIHVAGSGVARCVSPLSTQDEDDAQDEKTFNILFSAFGNTTFANLAPRPIAPTHALSMAKKFAPKPTALPMPRMAATVTPSSSSTLLNKLAASIQLLRSSSVAV